MSTIAAIYKMIVFTSGEVETQLMPMEYLFDDVPLGNITVVSSNISQKVYQIVRVLQIIKVRLADASLSDENLFTFKTIITEAARTVALELQISEQSVNDKYTRQLEGDKNDFTPLVMDFFQSGYTVETFQHSGLYKKIREFLNTEYDIQYLETSFKNLF